jgi:hypothetical protein
VKKFDHPECSPDECPFSALGDERFMLVDHYIGAVDFFEDEDPEAPIEPMFVLLLQMRQNGNGEENYGLSGLALTYDQAIGIVATLTDMLAEVPVVPVVPADMALHRWSHREDSDE